MNIENEQQTPSLQQKAGRLSHLIVTSKAFENEMRQGASRLDAIKAAADSLHEMELPAAELTLLDAMTQTGEYIDARIELDSIIEARDLRPLSNEEKRRTHELKERHIIPFNHSLKELINAHPNESFSETSNVLTVSYMKMFSTFDTLNNRKRAHDIPRTSDVSYRIEESLNGMRHEIGAESLMTASGIDYYYDISTSEDSHGTDLYFHNGTEWIPIDVKASDTGVQKAHTQGRYNAISTGLTPADFRGQKNNTPGALTISFNTAVEKTDTFSQKLVEISNEYTRLNQVRSVGRAAVQR